MSIYGDDQEDGLLTMSEIFGLRLDADMVVLSACQTGSAAGDDSRQGLSGLARAFFFAGTPSSAGVAWTAAPDYAGHPAWFVLGATSGVVHSLSSDSVPLTIRRDALPALGAYTGCVIVAGGDTARTVTVVTALTESGNGMFPRIGGDACAYAGMPYLLDARASKGWIGTFYWVTNYTTNVSVEVQAFSTGPVGDMVFDEPDEFDLSLVSKDEHERTTIDTKPSFRVWNSPPRVSCGGPYRAMAGDTVTVVAVGMDPNPNEKLLYSWQFVGHVDRRVGHV